MELFANDDDDQEDSERDVVFESQEKAEDEAQKAVGVRDPGAPTSAEVAEHELTHLPHRSWCAACVSERCDRQHRRLDGRDQLEVPCVVFDCGFFGGEGDEETLAVQIAKDVGTKMLFAHVVPKKGVMVNHGVTQLMKGHRQAWSQEVVSQKRRRTSTRRHSGRGEETEN